MIHLAPRHKALLAPVLPKLEELFPVAPRLTHKGKEMIVLPHNNDSTRLLSNMGYDVPAPIMAHYDWAGGRPFVSQRNTAALLTTNKRAYVLNGMGTGKTKAALWAWHFLYKEKLCGKLLVVAPLSTLDFVWMREIFRTLPGIRAQVLHGSKARRLERLADRDADIYIINHDGLQVVEAELKARRDINCLVIDELATYRNGGTARTKKMRAFAERFLWAWGMTGSPTPRAPTDAWGQCTVITPWTVPKYFTRFRDQLMNKVTNFKWLPKPDALERVYECMQPAVRYTLDDVTELPDLIERTIDVGMGVKQAKVYKEMESFAHTAIQNKTITAMNAGAVLNKLLQISCGYVYTRDHEVVPLDNDARLDAMVDAIMDCNEKVIVFVPFKHALDGLVERVTREGIEVARVSGDTSKSARDGIFSVFQNTESIRVLCAHPACMSHGLTLTAATTIIWFAPIADLEIFEQANARIRRVGQKKKQQILMFQATRAERQLYARLRAKAKVQNMLLDMFATEGESDV